MPPGVSAWIGRRGEPWSREHNLPGLLVLRYGIDLALEDQANTLLREHRKSLALSEKNEILTWDQMKLRWSREVYSLTGILDANFVPGLYKRAYNPLLGNRPKRPEHPD